MKKIRLTAFSFEKEGSLRELKINDKVKIEKDYENEFDEFALKVEFPNGMHGFIGNKETTTVTGVLGKEYYKYLPDCFEGKIDEFFINAIRNRTAVSVTVLIKDNVTKSNVLDLTFKGTYKQHPNKSKVVDMLNKKENPFIELIEKNDEIIAYYKNSSIGKLNESNLDVSQLSKLKAYISNCESVTGKATCQQGRDIIVQVSIDDKKIENNNNNKLIDIDTLIDKIVKENIASREKCEKVLDYLKKYSISEKIINKIFLSYKKYPDDLQQLIPTPSTFYNDSLNIIRKNLLYMNIKKHIRLVGGKGTGKNKLVETLGWIYNRPLLKLSISREVDKLDLLGSQKLEDGKILFEPGIVPIAMKYGCILNLDEINTANPGLLTLLHSATDWSSSLYVPGYKTIKADDNFCLIATMNENYNGTADLNQATKDRFTTIRIPYPKKISDTLKSQINCDEIVFNTCDVIFEEIFKAIRKGELSDDCLTVRGFLSAIEVFNEGMDLDEALIDNIVNPVDDEMEREIIMEAIDLACD